MYRLKGKVTGYQVIDRNPLGVGILTHAVFDFRGYL